MATINVGVDPILRTGQTSDNSFERFSVEAPAGTWDRAVQGIAVYNLAYEDYKKPDYRLECHADGMVFRLNTRDARNLAEALLQAADACDAREKSRLELAAELKSHVEKSPS